MGAWTHQVVSPKKKMRRYLVVFPSVWGDRENMWPISKDWPQGGWNIRHRVPPSPYPWPSGAICVVAMTRWEGTPGADEHPSHRNHAAPVERNGKLMIDRIRIE